jgi:hypothetical protein
VTDVFFLIIFVWLAIITAFLLRIFFYYRILSKDVKKGNLIKILDKVLEEEEVNTKAIAGLSKLIDKIQEKDKFHIQKVAIVRFNPFKELGGDHSFSLALLDDKDTGVILTGLHARERTRVYAKKVTSGKSDITLSFEERKALEEAIEH